MTTRTESKSVTLGAPVLSVAEFHDFQRMIYAEAGIHMTDSKRTLVAGRLAKRVKALSLRSYADYWHYLCQDPTEQQTAIDLLTTNETYFFREEKHFDFLQDQILPHHDPQQPMRIWSAACSSGEEPYTIAMVLAEGLGQQRRWEVLASDISNQVLDRARAGCYPLSRSKRIPQDLLKRYCLRGTGGAEGTLLVDSSLRARVSFAQINLNTTLPNIGTFDVIFLRNVMIYFNLETKQQIVSRLIRRLRPGGYFIVGHSESLNGFQNGLDTVSPSVYQAKPK
ncbi:MAG: protein-glutamate O-methyltransferase CheR [Natronospirillum sp.]